MPSSWQVRKGGRRWSAATPAVLLIALVSMTACSPAPAGPAPNPVDAGATPSVTTPPAPPALPPAEPTRIEIPAIGVDAPVGRVGLNSDGTVEVPPLSRAGDTGWYGYGPTPGEVGPAVVLGHVDSEAGPAVFFRLKELRPGDMVRIRRGDGRTAIFRITVVEEFLKTRFPTERVYGDTDHPALRLVTCGGTYDRTRASYKSNVIAFAELAGTR